MEKRVTLTLVLCFAVVVLWTTFINPPDPPRPAKPASDGRQAEETTKRSGDTPQGKPAAQPEEQPAVEPGQKPVKKPGRPRVPEETTTIDTGLVRYELTNKGASVTAILLKSFYDEPALPLEARQSPAHWLRVLGEFEQGRRPLAVKVRGEAEELDQVTWKRVGAPAFDDGVHTVAFETVLDSGVKLTKELRFPDDGYSVDMALRFDRGDAGAHDTFRIEVMGPTGILMERDAMFTPFAAVDQGMHRDPAVHKVGDHLEENAIKRRRVTARPRYLAVSDKYFISLFMLPEDQRGVFQFGEAFTGAVVDEAAVAEQMQSPRGDATALRNANLLLEAGAYYDVNFADGETVTEAVFSLYAGPRRAEEFAASGAGGFVSVLDVVSYVTCGLDFIVRPISAACKFFLNLFHGITGNYGVAILMLTLMVKILMFPLTRKQMVSMQKYAAQMGKIKPEMERLNQKYKTNPKKKQQELMKLYKEHKINPVPWAGCLPLLVNMPVFFGLFHALRSAIDLRHAPFVAWIKDLSAPDALITFAEPVPILCLFTLESLNILPLLMGVTWFTQMYMAPRPADPQAAQQQKMMMFMPIMFTFFFYNYAAGLSLYWTFNNFISIIEQKVIKRGRPVEPPAAPPPAQTRKKKK